MRSIVVCQRRIASKSPRYLTHGQLIGKLHIATVTGTTSNILLGERTALNIIARSSGISSRAARLRKIADKSGYKGIIAGTRKTTPGFRIVEKYAMLVGNVLMHNV